MTKRPTFMQICNLFFSKNKKLNAVVQGYEVLFQKYDSAETRVRNDIKGIE